MSEGQPEPASGGWMERWRARWSATPFRQRRAYVGLFVAVLALGAGAVAFALHDGGAPEEARVLSVSPSGDEAPRLGPIVISFVDEPSTDQPEDLVSIEPAPEGEYVWLDDRTLLFQPDFPGLQRGAQYQVSIEADRAGLEQDFTQAFTVEGKLLVRSVIPAPSDAGVPPEARVFVQFSRAVAPLTLLSEQPVDEVVRFDPPLQGSGEWLNTSLYMFTPQDLQPSTTYQATVAAGLSSAADGVLEADYTWEFSTYQPAVAGSTPADGTVWVTPDSTVSIEFNQPMDRASAEAGIHVAPQGGAAVASTFAWSEDSRSVVVTPSAPLAIDTTYVVTVDAGVAGAIGGATQAARTTTFTTVSTPRVVSTSPADGESNAGRFGVWIEFNQPIDFESLEPRVSISGIDSDDYEIFDYDTSIQLNTPLSASTTYTVTIAAGAVDRAGLAIPPYSFTFTTGAREPQVAYVLSADYSEMGVYSADGPQELYFWAVNMPEVDFELYRLDEDRARSLLADGHLPNGPLDLGWWNGQELVRSWSAQGSVSENRAALRITPLGGEAALPPGYYFVRSPFGEDAASIQYGAQLFFAVVDTQIVTKIGTDELLVWAVDEATGEPVDGLDLSIAGPGLAGWAPVTTDADGVATVAIPRPSEVTNASREYAVEVDADGRFGATRTEWASGSEPWILGLPIDYWDRQAVAHVYTDRPIYRTGETVHFKAVVRLDDDATYSLPPAGETGLTIVVIDAQGEEVHREPVVTNAFGTFAGDLDLPEGATTGFYSVAILEGRQGFESWITSTAFQVAEFRVPEFRVEMTPAQTEYPNGATISVDVEASFFFGGPLEGATVQWTAYGYPTSPFFPDFPRYSFSDFDAANSAVFEDPLRASGEVVTDATGHATITVPASLRANESTTQFMISATVLDQSGQALGTETSVDVHPASIYAGVTTEEYVGVEGRPVQVQVATVDIDGAAAPNRSVTVQVYEREWITVREETEDGRRRYRSDPRDTLVDTLTVQTGADGLGSASYTPERSGEVRLVATTVDDQGRTARAASSLWVSGGEFARWAIGNDSVIPLIADRESYAVGDTAQVLVPAPFAGSQALITIERGGVLQREVRVLEGNSETLSIPIEDRFVPNVFASVVLYRPPTEEDPVPRYHVGYVELKVSTDTRVLNVDVQSSVEQAAPGDTVSYDVTVTDSQGRPVEAELSIDMVDAAVLSLSDLVDQTGLQAFWFERGLAVRTGSSLTVSIDRANDTVDEASVGGKGGGAEGDVFRSNFQNTAYWSAQVQTDASGHASFEVELPDNLTTWRTQVRAVSGSTQVGEATHELLSTKSLLVRPALPRFLRVGDQVSLRTLVRNATATAQEVTVALEASGVTLDDGGDQTVTVQPGQSGEFEWAARATATGTATIAFSATAGELADAVSIDLPVHLDVTPETVATGGVVTDESALEAFYLPNYAILDHGSLEVRLQGSLVGALDGELSALAPTTFESTVRTASRIVGKVASHRATGDAEEVVLAAIEGDIGRLQAAQRVDGGWGWCGAGGSCPSDPVVTAWVLLALGEARVAGWEQETWAGSAEPYLRNQINSTDPVDVEHPLDPNERVFMYYALVHGYGRESYLNSLLAIYEQGRELLTPWGQAYLILALLESGEAPDSTQVRALIGDLNAGVLPSANGNHWEGAPVYGSIESNVSMTALVLRALVAADPGHPLIEETVRWIVAAREADDWETPIERSQAMAGLADYAAMTGETRGDFDYRVVLDGTDLLEGHLGGDDASAVGETFPLRDFAKDAVHRLSFERERSAGRMYYLLNLRYVTPAAEVEALSRGLSVAHAYTSIGDPDTPISSAGLGEVVRVTVTVVSDADRKFVQVEDLLPAGLEAIDSSLATVPEDVRRALEEERRRAVEGDAADQDAYAPWYPWYWSPWDETNVRDDRFTLFATELPRGVHEYVYYARATTPGDFFVAPAHAEESPFPEIFGRSDSSRFTVTQ